jgi:hypothetical protein
MRMVGLPAIVVLQNQDSMNADGGSGAFVRASRRVPQRQCGIGDQAITARLCHFKRDSRPSVERLAIKRELMRRAFKSRNLSHTQDDAAGPSNGTGVGLNRALIRWCAATLGVKLVAGLAISVATTAGFEI